MRRRRPGLDSPAFALLRPASGRSAPRWARLLSLGGALGLAGCEALFGSFATGNPESCTATPDVCGPDYCNEKTRLCEPAMAITGVSPVVALGSGGDTLTVTGSQFAEGVVVRLGDAVVGNLMRLGSEKLTGTVPESSARGLVPVEVELPSGQRVRRDELFRYVPPIKLDTPAELLVPYDPRFVTAADLNRDGRMDVILTGTSPPSYVYYGKSDGGFVAGPTVQYSGRARNVTVGDLNGDGFLDLGMANLNSTDVQIVLGTAAGGFQPAVAKLTTGFPLSGQFGDHNGDGKLDLLTVEGTDAKVYPGVGDGSFGAAIASPALASGPVAGVVTVSDLDGDGKLDVVAGSTIETRLFVLRGLGDGRFEAPVQVGLPSTPLAVVITDFNKDGRTELTVNMSPSGSPNIVVFERQPGLTFVSGVSLTLGFNLDQIAVGDVNGDGFSDIVGLTAAKRSPNIALVASLGDGRFAPPKFETYGVTLRGPALLEASGDARTDFVYVDSYAYGTSGNFMSKLAVERDVSP